MLERLFDRDFFHPHHEIFSFRPFERFFREGQENTFRPALNLWRGEDQMLVTMELPGVEPKEVDISVHGKRITIKGERKAPELKEKETFHRLERAYGPFVRTFELPYPVDAERVRAEYKSGVLTITFARTEEDKPKKIEIKTS